MNDQKKKWTKEIAIGGVILAGIILLLVLIIGRSGITNVRNQSSEEASTIASSTDTASGEADTSKAASQVPSSSENTQNQSVYQTEVSPQSDSNKSEPTTTPKPEEKKDTLSDTITCYIEIRCDNLANDLSKLTNPAKAQYVPAGGVILPRTKMEIPKGQSVEYLTRKICQERGIEIQTKYYSEFQSEYFKRFANVSEFDGGNNSGWMFSLDGVYVDKGASRTIVNDGSIISWNYTCDLGNDLGATM